MVPAPLGTTLIPSLFRWGPAVPVVHPSESDFLRVRGGEMVEDAGPTAARDFYALSGGSGRVVSHRVVPPGAAAASLGAYARDINAHVRHRVAEAAPTLLFTLDGAYVGRRGGRLKRLAGDGSASFDAAAGTFATAVAVTEDEWRGALLTFESHATVYTVTGNSTAGLLTIEVNPTDPGPPTLSGWWLEMPNTNVRLEADGFAAAFGSGQRLPATEFSLKLAVDGASTLDEQNLSVSTGQTDVVESLRAAVQSGRQNFVLATLNLTPLADDQMRPANWVGRASPSQANNASTVVTNVVTVSTQFWAVTNGATDAYAHIQENPFGATPIKHRAVISYTDGVGAFTVQYQLWDGTVISDGLPAGTSGTLFNPDCPFLASFLVRGSAWSAGDELTIWFDPLPLGLRDLSGFLYPHGRLQGAVDLRTRYRIVGNTATTVTLATAVTLGVTDGVVEAIAPIGTAITPGAPTYTLPIGTETFIYEMNDDGTDNTLTLTEGGGAITIVALAAALNALETTLHTAEERIFFFVDAAGTRLSWRALLDEGSTATIEVKVAGTLFAVLGIVGDTTYTGVDGTVMAVQYAEDFHGGIDDTEALTTEFEDTVFDVVDSPLNVLDEQNLGLVVIGTPGRAAVVIQQAAIDYCFAQGWLYRGEVTPANAANQAAAIAWVTANIDPRGSYVTAFDSYGRRKRVQTPGVPETGTMSGAIWGMEAAVAADSRGYHVAPSGRDARIDKRFSLIASATAGVPVPLKDDGPLNAVGIQTTQQQGGRIYIFGDQVPASNFLGTLWYHKLRAVLHIARELLFVGRRYDYAPITSSLWRRVESDIRGLMLPKFNDDWFIRGAGQGFDDVLAIRADADLNPIVVQQLGKVIASLTILTGIIDTTKNTEFIVGVGSVAVIER